MANASQLEWEQRLARRAAIGAFAGGVLVAASVAVQLPALQDTPGSKDPDRYRATLLSYQDHAGSVLASAIIQAIGTAAVAGVLYYLFKAVRLRRPELPSFLRFLLVIAPIGFLVGGLVNNVDLKDLSNDYTQNGARTELKAPPTTADRAVAKKRCATKKPATDACVTREARRAKIARENRQAKKLLEDKRSVFGAALGFAGSIALAFSFVMISLNAMRAGLLSRFLGVLGVLSGGLMVIPLLPLGGTVIEIFWLGAIGALLLDRLPGGRGPAWETGEAVPWPVPEGGGGLFAPRRPPAPEPEPEPEPEQTPRPNSRKRKKKKKR